jgi:dolichol-phosphate mannosyltransferase
MGTLVDMLLLWVLAEPRFLGLPVLPSKVIAAEVALINNFVLNEIWTFRKPAGTRGHGSVYKRLLFFNTICGVGILIAGRLRVRLSFWFSGRT